MWVNHAPGALALATAMAFVTLGSPDGARTPSRTDSPEVRLSITATMEDGEPVGAAESFPADVGEVYAVLEVENAPGETFGVVFGVLGSASLVEVRVQGDPDRQWAAMVIPSEATGEWSVAVVHDGETLTTKLFTVGS